ncbi:hypothetical protein GEMRC1_010932 [Eukaryota sp. GEM-RC1]
MISLTAFVIGILLGVSFVIQIHATYNASRRHRTVRTSSSTLDTNCEWFNQIVDMFLEYLLDVLTDDHSLVLPHYLERLNAKFSDLGSRVNIKVLVDSIIIHDVSCTIHSIETPRSPQRTGEKKFRTEVSCTIDCETLLTLTRSMIVSLTVNPRVHSITIKTVLDISLTRTLEGIKLFVCSAGSTYSDIAWSIPIGFVELSSEATFLNLTKGLLSKSLDHLFQKGFGFTIPLAVSHRFTISPTSVSTSEVTSEDASPKSPEVVSDEEVQAGAGLGRIDSRWYSRFMGSSE